MGNSTVKHYVSDCTIEPVSLQNGGIYLKISNYSTIGQKINWAIETVLYGLAELLDDYDFSVLDRKNSYAISGNTPTNCLSTNFTVFSYPESGFAHELNIVEYNVDFSLVLPDARSPYLKTYTNYSNLPIVHPNSMLHSITNILYDYFSSKLGYFSILELTKSNKNKELLNIINPLDVYHKKNRSVNWWHKLNYLYNEKELISTDDYWLYYLLSKMEL